MALQPQISSLNATRISELTIIISEIAWAGTAASSSDEWIEIYNPGLVAIDLSGWKLVSNDGSPDIDLEGSIPPGGFYLLERSDDNTISNIPADDTYSGALGNSGETLSLFGPSGERVDTANLSGGTWPEGDPGSRASMERSGIVPDSPSAWGTNDGITVNGQDANGDPIRGSPKAANSLWVANPTATPTATPSPSSTNSPTFTATPTTTLPSTPTPSSTPTATLTADPSLSVVINEIAWSGTSASSGDEWIELYNLESQSVDLNNWTIQASDGVPSITLSGTIPAHGYFLLERTDDTTIRDIRADQIYTGPLSNSGESLTLRDADGNLKDSVNLDGGAWPGGTSGSGIPQYATLERVDASAGGLDSNWGTNNGVTRNGEDANGNPINGTPKSVNSTSQAALPTHTNTNTLTSTNTLTTKPTASGTPTITPSPSSTNTPTSTQTPSPTSSPSQTGTPTITSTATSTQTTTPIPSGSIVVNEIAWAGTQASSYDEWIELFNPSSQSFDFAGWILKADDGSPNIALEGIISAGNYFLLERSDEDTISDIAADQIYTGTLSNTGETLRLYGPSGEVIDTANIEGGEWPAGDAALRASMERHAGIPDGPSAWGTNSGDIKNSLDAQGNPIRGSPKRPNSVLFWTATPTPTQTGTATLTPTSTSTPSPTATVYLYPPQTIWINEIAWSGTRGHYNDEWIELFNASYDPVDLSGWKLIAADGRPKISLDGKIAAWGFFLLERTDDTTIADIPADQIYTGSLSNNGETLYLYGPHGELVDIASQSNGRWPKGDADTRATMERRGTRPDGHSTWNTNNGYMTNGIDVDGYPIRGTPKKANSNWFPTPTPTLIPEGTLMLINEFLPHPKYDWNGDGKFSSGDEFIELINAGLITTNLQGWLLDDIEGGSTPYELPNIDLAPGERISLFRAETGISLADDGDYVRLLNPNGTIVDERAYNYADDVNLSWCRLPDGIEELAYPCWPTPGNPNAGYKVISTTSLPTKEPEQTDDLPDQRDLDQINNIIQPGWLIPSGSRMCGYQ